MTTAIIPESLDRGHDNLQQQCLVKATQAGGSTAAAAKKVVKRRFMPIYKFEQPSLVSWSLITGG